MTAMFVVIFNEKRPTPKYITYLGNVLPGAIFAMLIVTAFAM